jgi:serine/threonine protein kinase
MGNTTNKDTPDKGEIDISNFEGTMQTNMLKMKQDDVFKKYRVLEVIGKGSMGYTANVKIRNKKLGGSAATVGKKGILQKMKRKCPGIDEFREETVEYALKSIQVEGVSEKSRQEIRNEINILKVMDHPNIIRAYEVFENTSNIYLVLEWCDGGDLYTRGPYSEKYSRRISKQLLSAVKYMHDRGVVHRDLKFENIMWENDSEDSEIKIINFGLSRKFGYGEQDVMSEGVGTMYTMAPQVLQGVYTSQADLWSCGVIIYMLLSSHRPFRHKKRLVMIDRMMRAKYSVTGKGWEGISLEAVDLVTQLIKLDPEKRLNATSALKHVWLSADFEPAYSRRDTNEDKKMMASMAAYGNSSKLKKIAMNIIAHKSSSKEIMGLKKRFVEYDSSNDGIIEFHEFKAALKEANYAEEDISKMFKGVDIDNNGMIEYTEFIASTIEAYGKIEEERIAEAFDQLDEDSSGRISRANLLRFLGQDARTEEVDEMLYEWDENKDGMSKFQEEFLY